jgi:TonB dependent receptor-like, beta-barrel/CarboxypepD_reg-like domain/TonB-dependent Receptor Plug Domain
MKIVFIIIGLLICSGIIADEDNVGAKYTISGYVTDLNDGEQLLGATILVNEIQSGTITNLYGFYSLSLEPGIYTLNFSYLGYETIEKKIELKKNITLNIELSTEGKKLQEIVIQGDRKNSNITNAEMSAVKMQMQTIRKIPALMGEVDIIKAIQLLPGVQSTSEGSSGFSVRGGSSDQNLILLDEATVYNASHLMGFFSVFNNDAIKDVKLYKGDIPASSGGRLSSLLDVRMKDGNSKKISGTGGIGTISSRFTLEGPIQKDKTSFIMSGRRTYMDLFLPFAKDEDIRNNKLFFYDLNLKINHTINEDNRIFLSGYFGRDVFKSDFFRMAFGNRTMTVRWNHLFSKKLFSNISVIFSKYDYHLGTAPGEATSFVWYSNLNDKSLKYDYTFFLNPDNTVRFGLISTFHSFTPGSAKGIGDETFFNEWTVPDIFALQHGIYASNEQKIGGRLILKYGIRYSAFQNIGKGIVYDYNSSFEAIDTTFYKRGEFYNTYSGFEPRFGFNFIMNESSSIKGSYSRTMQYIQLAQNSTSGSPLDIWFPSSPNVKPQISDQFAIGYFKNLFSNKVETSVEVYYKAMNNVIDFKDHAELLLNDQMEGELRFGEATSYGAEFLIRLNLEKLNGWIGYTYAKTERTIEEINNGKPYRAPYDKPHDLAIVLNYQINKRITISGNWIYSTGQAVTMPEDGFYYHDLYAPIYSQRNEDRFPDYHRLDLSLTLASKEKPNKAWSGEWNFSVYNVYSRKNPWSITTSADENGKPYAEMTYLFPIIPSITYNFKF